MFIPQWIQKRLAVFAVKCLITAIESRFPAVEQVLDRWDEKRSDRRTRNDLAQGAGHEKSDDSPTEPVD